MLDISYCPNCDTPVRISPNSRGHCKKCMEYDYWPQFRLTHWEAVWEPSSAQEILARKTLAGMLPVAAVEPQPVPSAPPSNVTTPETTPYSALLAFAAEELKGGERKTIELLCRNNGSMEKADFALAMGWDSFDDGKWSSLQSRLNKKLRRQGWCVDRRDNRPTLRTHESATKK